MARAGVAPPPRGVWSPAANAERELPEDDAAVAALTPTHVFRRDLLAYCTLRNLLPHPQLLPLHADEEERQGAASGADAATTANVYDVSEVEELRIKHWQLDPGNCRALCFALPLAAKVRSLCLFNAGLDAEQLALLCATIPSTHVTALQLEWNELAPPESSKPPAPAPAPTSRPASAGAEEPQEPAELSERELHELEMQRELACDGRADVSELFALLLGAGSALVFLSLRANGITSRGAAALATALRSNTTLESLNLFQNRIGDAGARAFAHALPQNTTLKTLSLANNQLSGRGAKLLVDGLTQYEAPPELLQELEAAESRVQALIDQAKKAKKKLERTAAMAQLGLPVLETVGGVQLAPGNATLEELLLSGNSQLGPRDVATLSDALDAHRAKLQTHLRCIKLQRLPQLRASEQPQSQRFSDFLKL